MEDKKVNGLYKAKSKQNGEWVEGCYVKYHPCASRPEYVHGIVPTYASALYMIEVDPETLCQYTGLNDKNGNKIWENDILHRPYHKKDDCIVFWNDGRYSFKTIHGQYNQDPMTILSLCFSQKTVDILKVIGNIFDNPELMEGEAE